MGQTILAKILLLREGRRARGGGGGEGGSARFLMQLRKTFGARQHKRRLSMFLEPLVVRVFYKTKNLYNTYQLVLGVVPLLNGWC